jgi:hypothetical protein
MRQVHERILDRLRAEQARTVVKRVAAAGGRARGERRRHGRPWHFLVRRSPSFDHEAAGPILVRSLARVRDPVEKEVTPARSPE